MVVCVPVTADGSVDRRWAGAARVAVADVQGDACRSWEVFPVGWDTFIGTDEQDAHLARVGHFLTAQRVAAVAAYEVGDEMLRMLFRMGLHVQLAASGSAREAALAAAAAVSERKAERDTGGR